VLGPEECGMFGICCEVVVVATTRLDPGSQVSSSKPKKESLLESLRESLVATAVDAITMLL